MNVHEEFIYFIHMWYLIGWAKANIYEHKCKFMSRRTIFSREQYPWFDGDRQTVIPRNVLNANVTICYLRSECREIWMEWLPRKCARPLCILVVLEMCETIAVCASVKRDHLFALTAMCRMHVVFRGLNGIVPQRRRWNFEQRERTKKISPREYKQ